eukprot:3879722-Amphidinium_carterae.1
MDGSSNQPVPQSVPTIPIGIAMNPREEEMMSCPTSVIGSTIPRDQTAPRPMSTLSDPRFPLQEPEGYEPNQLTSDAGRTQVAFPEIPVGAVRSAIGSITARFNNKNFNLFGNSGTSTPQRTPPATPRYQGQLGDELEAIYGREWRDVQPDLSQGVQSPGTVQRNNELLLQLQVQQRNALAAENYARQHDLERVLQEHALQSDSFNDTLRTLEATRAEQQSMELLLSERDEEIAALRAAVEARIISAQQAPRQLPELSPRQPAVTPPPPPQTPQN